MFDEMTEEYFLRQAEQMGTELGVDVSQGSIYMDAAKGHIIRASKFFEDLRITFDMLAIDTAPKEILIERGKERGLPIHEATPSKWGATFEGATPSIGDRFFVDEFFFTWKNEENIYFLEAETTGTATNNLTPGSALVPVINIDGLTAATLGELITAGTDEEDTESYRTRLKEKISGPAENGNKQHYKTWCEEVTGVGRARIIPLWNGPNTVKGIIISTEGAVPLQTVVDAVQEYVDPGAAGLGEGVANLGAHFTAEGAAGLAIDVSFTATLREGYTLASATTEAETAFRAYLKKLALESVENETIVVRLSAVGAIISGLSSILDYYDLKLNGAASNIEPGTNEVAILGEVVIDVGV